jgi:hypothetical protein
VQPTQDVDYWIREATAARQAEMALRRELEALAQPANYLHAVLSAFGPDEGISLDQKGWSQLHAALKAVLAQPAQEPVAWCWIGRKGWTEYGPIPHDTYPSKPLYAVPLPTQPAQEPVAWAVQGCSKMWRGEFAEIDAKAEAKRIGGTCVAYALYTAPPQRPWMGLTDDELADIWYKESLDWMEFARAHEAALKEKNFD